MSHYKILVCGSRDYPDEQRVHEVLDKYYVQFTTMRKRHLLIITGGADGADEFARRWAVAHRVDHLVMYARWDDEGKAAGPIRNRRMADQEPDYVIAFSKDFENSRGTKNMISQAEKRHIRVRKYR